MREAHVTLALGLLLASTLAMAAGQLVQKQRVTARSVERPLGPRGRGFGLLLARLARDPVWLLGHLCAMAGALLGLQAMASLDLLVLKSFGRLETLFVVLGGAWFLGERLRPNEWLGVAAMLAGATLLGIGRSSRSGVVASTPENIAFFAACVGALGLVALSHRRWPARVRSEVALALAGGLFFGGGDVMMKGVTTLINSRPGGFSVLNGAALAALIRAPEFLLAVPGYAAGMVCVQGAFAVGRASLIGPLLAIGGTLLPIGFGIAVLREDVSASRLGAVVLLLAGAALVMARTPALLAEPRSQGAL
jgi:drug/metabolite transporter (DMT)-like permease